MIKTTPLILTLALSMALSACVFTGSDFAPSPQINASPKSNLPAASIMITETSLNDRSYTIIGKTTAYARMLNLLSSEPTRADVDEALRVEAAKQGADAVINVRYSSERTGLDSRGKMSGTGDAIIFKK